MLGILGGMGPLATVDLMQKIIARTPAATDQQHIPMIAYLDGRIPDRRAAILDVSQPSPLPKMISGIRTLEMAGAQCIVIACNTAHHWSSALAAAASVPIIDIDGAVCAELHRRCQSASRVGVLATHATLISGFYQRSLEAAGFAWTHLSEDETFEYIEAAIACVKRGDVRAGTPLLEQGMRRLANKGADVIVLGCTELPIAYAGAACSHICCVDATEALAQAAVDWHFHARSGTDDRSEYQKSKRQSI